MALVATVTMLAVIEYFVFAMLTGQARATYKVEAPATTGHPVFERYYRVQQNSLEQLAVFLPSLWIFGSYVNAPAAAVLGLAFIVGRLLYFRGYIADPGKRGTGFAIGLVATVILALGALGGALVAAL